MITDEEFNALIAELESLAIEQLDRVFRENEGDPKKCQNVILLQNNLLSSKNFHFAYFFLSED